MKNLVKFSGLLVLAWAAINMYFWTQKTDRCYCVTVTDKADFTGKWMKHERAESEQIVKTTDCQKTDSALDSDDGNKTGRVRWVECLSGPDCDEGGNF